jgi:uncharacterized protein
MGKPVRPVTFYLDASAIVPLFVDEAFSAAVRQWVIGHEGRLHVSNLSVGEAHSAYSKRLRKNETTAEIAAEQRVETMRWIDAAADFVPIVDDDLAGAALLVREPFPRLLMPDAIHLAVCKRARLTLVTLDSDLLIIAAREGVAALSPA